MTLEKLLDLKDGATKAKQQYFQISSFDLPYKKHFLIDLMGTILVLRDYEYKLRNGIYEFLTYYKQKNITLSLQSDALRLKNPKKEYKLTQATLKEIKSLFKEIKSEINLNWLNLFDNIYDRTWKKKIHNPFEISHFRERYKFNYPLQIKDYEKMAYTTSIPLEDTVVIGDEPDITMSKITKIQYFPIKSQRYLNFKKLIR